MWRYIGNGGYVLGVPARDLTEHEWLSLTREQRAAAKGLYRKDSRTSKAKKEFLAKLEEASEDVTDQS